MKRLIEVKTGNVVSEDTFKKLHKNTLFGGGISEEVARVFGYSVILNDPKPEYNNLSHTVEASSIEKRENRWYQTWVVIERPDAAKRVRDERNTLLSDSDWVVIMHTEKGTNIPANWEIYRQTLRDITDQAGFPYSVEWPTKPE